MPGFSSLSRREFLQVAGLGAAGLFLQPAFPAAGAVRLVDFPAFERLGRVLDGQVNVKVRPDEESATVGVVNSDDVVIWLRETTGSRPTWFNQKYVETPEGYIYAPNLQFVNHQLNQPLTSLPNETGMWVEVSVPYVDLILANPPARAPWVRAAARPRLYYGQIMFVDQIKLADDGQVLYHVVDRYGSFGDKFWAAGEAFRLLTEEDMNPINPEADNKLVVVRLLQQSLSCYEGQNEVFFCRVSTGGKFDADGNPSQRWATPVGTHTIWRKLVALHMTGGTTGGGWDLSGVGWTTLFSGQGMAIHSTFWHNSFGIPRSRGCVNVLPQDAQWIWRWTLPVPPAEPGDITISGMGSTRVQVIEE